MIGDENSMVEDLLTIGEVALRLRVDSTTVRRWIRAGLMEAVELPHGGERVTFRIRRSEYERIVKEGTLNGCHFSYGVCRFL